MTRVTDVTDYDTGSPQCFSDPIDLSETQYHSPPAKPLLPLASSLCRSELSLSSREDFPGTGRSSYRTGSAAIRSASLSPSRVRELSSLQDLGKSTPTSPRHYDIYSRSRSPDAGLFSRLKSESHVLKGPSTMAPPRDSQYHSGGGVLSAGGGKTNSYRMSHQFMEYNPGNSDLDLDQNTSGDLLNLSNLSLSDDCILNDNEPPQSPLPYSGASLHSYSPRDFGTTRRLNVSSPSFESVRHIVSPREIIVPKRGGISSTILSNTPKSILSPRIRQTDLPTSISLSDSIHRILQPSESLDSSASPRRQKPSWQTYRPGFLHQPPPRSSIRRSVTFIEPEFENPYIFRDDDVGLYSGSYGSLKRHSTTSPSSSWESSDHERYLRDKHGREKDAFREKIERLKELIQENKVEDVIKSGANYEKAKKASPLSNIGDFSSEDKTSRDNSLDRDWKSTKSRRSSLARELSSDNEDAPPSQATRTSEKKLIQDVNLDSGGDESFSEPMTDKEQWSGQFSEKEEDVSESDVLQSDSQCQKQDNERINRKQKETDELDLIESTSLKELDHHASEENIPIQHSEGNLTKYLEEQHPHEKQEAIIQDQVKDSADFIQSEVQQLQDTMAQDNIAEENQLNNSTDFVQKNELYKQQEDTSVFQEESPSLQGDQRKYEDLNSGFVYDNQQQQQQEWSVNEDDGSQSIQYAYEQGEVSPSNYEQQDQGIAVQRQESGLEHYPTNGEVDQQEYEKYQANAQQQQAQGEYVDSTGYKPYAEPQQAEDSESVYQTYSEDPNQYQQGYQSYPEDQQYGEQQDQNYSTQDQNNFQYPQDPNKAQYEYDAQDYNYQQGQKGYSYSQAPNYQQDSVYNQQDQAYSQEQSYQPEQNYTQEQNYQQNESYEHTGDYQQDQSFQRTGYEGSQQYGNYQPSAEDLSEDTSQSVDSSYQGQYQGNEATNPKSKFHQTR